MTERETIPLNEIYAVDACPTVVVCKMPTIHQVQAALFQGWEFLNVTGVPLQCGHFRHPSGALVPIYQFGKDFVKIVKTTDIVAIEGDYVPDWAYPALGVVTVSPKPSGLLLGVYKYYTETGGIRKWITELRPVAAAVDVVEETPAPAVEAPSI